MIWTAFVALQLAAASPPLVLRDGQRSIRVATVGTVNGPMLRADALGAMLPIQVRHDSASAYTLEIWGARLQLQIGFQVVRVGDVVHPLAAPPVMQNGHLMVPLQMISEIFPVAVPNTRWDVDSRQLVVFNTTAAQAPLRVVAQSASGSTRPRRADTGLR